MRMEKRKGGNMTKQHYAGLDVAKFIFAVLIITLHIPLNEMVGGD